MKIVKKLHKKAKKLDACKLFTGNENFNEIVDLLFTPQGLEFCTNNNFPSLEDFKSFSDKELVKKGIYINKSIVELENIETVLIAGNTHAILNYNNVDVGYKVILMHGASAEIFADNYAVVFLYGETENATKIVSNYAIVK